MMTKSILVVCLGNICRSPLAHGIFEHYIKQQGLDWAVDSAGTGSWHIGEAPDPRSIEEAKRRGLDISNQRARQFSKTDFKQFDHIYVMDKSNYENVVSLAGSEEEKRKVSLMISKQEVPDPYFGGEEGFQVVYDMLEVSILGRLEELKKG